jgi:hypothetical protein
MCADVLTTGDDAKFSVQPAANKITYTWVVSAGSIKSGQGTPSIVVDTTGVPGYLTLTATVTATGLEDFCPKSASCAVGIIPQIGYHDNIDDYGNIRWVDEQARLDNLAVKLQEWPEGRGYIVAYGGRLSTIGEARRRAERARKYLMTKRNIPADQIVAIDGGYRERFAVHLLLRPKEAPPPEPWPTVDPGEIKFKRSTKPKAH